MKAPSNRDGASSAVADEELNEDALADQASADDDAEYEEYEEAVRPMTLRRWLEQGGSFGSSVLVHMLLFLLMGYISVGPSEEELLLDLDRIRIETPPVSQEEPLQAVDFNQQVQSQAQQTSATFASQNNLGEGGEIGMGMGLPSVSLDPKILSSKPAGGSVSVDRLTLDMPSANVIAMGVPDGAFGDPHAVVENYDQAFDRITEELLFMLSEQEVLVIWIFDQSESMKDDQQMIRERIETVYAELGVVGEGRNARLTTAVASFGASYYLHTKKPTADVNEIKAAIDQVPIDPSGEEMMCQAIGRSIDTHAKLAAAQDRKIALIVVTDESGNRQNNDQYLEQALAYAKASKSRIYVLGREAVFGYPYAHQRWRHPQTKHVHWIKIDRGPETALVENLQTDGFRKRYDAHPAGFGPYEQCRLAKETGGIFFMLPGIEVDIVRGDDREYALEAIRPYKPDLRSRAEVITAMQGKPLQQVLTKIVQDLNPYREGAAKIMEARMLFSPRVDQLGVQMAQELEKARIFLTYLDAAAKTLEQAKVLRHDSDRRRQANYDLMYAQVLAYTARRYEYIAACDHFVRNPPEAPPMEKPGFLRFEGWRVHGNKELLAPDVTQSYVDRSTEMFNQIIAEHPGSPWAARAEWELSRGFGITVKAGGYDYYGPDRNPFTGPKIPVPKL
ncbi:vWA domain-containing protein [Lignipirellula cremea]|nr:vWA domain-containing protein [Lignipirellula cremea]